jgi:hypothetical protein
MYTPSGRSRQTVLRTHLLTWDGWLQVGQLAKQVEKLNKSGVLKSMADVLEVRMLGNLSYRSNNYRFRSL